MKGMETGAKKMRVTPDLSRCVAQSAPHRFKVCNLKGKADKRLNYGEKKYVPKSCFTKLKQDFVATGKDRSMNIPIVIAAVKLKTCKAMFRLPQTSQVKLTTEEDSSGKSKKPVQKPGKPVEPVTDADWNNIPAPVYVEDVTTTTTTTVDEDSVDEDDTTTTTTTIIEDEALQNLLNEDREDVEEIDGLDMEVLDELGTDVDSVVEDRLEEERVQVQDGLQESAELDLDALGVAQIRALWQKRAEKNK
jgi:hypothetical protein